MKIIGNVICIDQKDICTVQADQGQSVICVDSTNIFQSAGFVINQTLNLSDGSTFIQGQELDRYGLTLSLNGPSFVYLPGSYMDGTTVVNFDGTYYSSRPLNPVWINYGIYYTADNTNWSLTGYRFREPMNPNVGFFYANMVVPSQIGSYKIQWLYKRDSSSYVTAVDQRFGVNWWGSGPRPPYMGPAYSEVEVIPAYQEKNIGDSVVFTIIIHNALTVPLTYQWRKRGINITDGGKFSGALTNILTITDITADEYDYYDCVVSGIIASTVGWLIVIGQTYVNPMLPGDLNPLLRWIYMPTTMISQGFVQGPDQIIPLVQAPDVNNVEGWK